MHPALIPTKLNIPPPRSGFIARTRLGEKIESALAEGCRLALVSAPAGSGKTTALWQWIADRGMPAAWYALDEGDNDPVRFWTYFISSVQSQIPGFGELALASLQPSQPVPAQAFASQLIGELFRFSHSLVIVLDDYHTIQNPAIHEALTYLLENQPPNLLVVIASRADPPMPLARWRSRRQLVELRAADMRFTIEEIGALLNGVMKLDLSGEDLAALEAQTEGWAAGLQLAALALQTRLAQGAISPDGISSYVHQLSGSNRFILDYLLGEVLEQQPESIRRFLLQTCILERLRGDLCDFVLEDSQAELPGSGDRLASQSPTGWGTVSSQQMLESLERANLFIVPLDDQRSWYRYHRLFGDLLRQRALLEYKDGLVSLHRKAAQWYEQHGFPADAIYHGLEAQDWDLVSRLVEQNTPAALARGETLTLSGWLARIPEQVVLSRPWLCISAAWVNLLTGGVARAGESADAAERAIAASVESGEEKSLQGQISAIRAYISIQMGMLEKTKELARKALELLPVDDLLVRSFVAFTLGGTCLLDDDLPEAQVAFLHASQVARAGGNIHIAAPSLRVIAQLLEARGELSQAETYCLEAVELAKTRSGRISPVAADAFGVLSDLEYERNDLPAAREHANRGAELAELLGNPDVMTSAFSRVARLVYLDGDLPAAREWLGKAERLMANASLSYGTGGSARELRVRLWIAAGDKIALRDWAEQQAALDGHAAGGVAFLNEADVRTRARAWLALGMPDISLGFLKRHLQWAEARGLAGMRIKNLALQALAYQEFSASADAPSAAQQALERLIEALLLAEAGRYMRTFLDEGAHLQALLSRVRLPGSGISRGYLAALLAAYPPQGAGAPGSRAGQAPSPLIEPLSEREIEVLRLVADGLSNQQIAAKLFISLGTVKAHTANIYSKLDARSRTQAVAAARDLGLI